MISCYIFVFGLLALASATECTSEEIRVATYNILYSNCGGYFDFCECSSSSPARYAAQTVQPDVLGTQENGCQVDFGNDMGAPYEVVPYVCQSCNHNAIYYNSDRIRYGGVSGVENTQHRDNYSLRMYSWSLMETQSGFAFWIFNVHNPHEHGNPYGFQANIAEQMINKYHEVSNGEPAVFTGDFNPHKDNNQWQRYAEDNGLTKVGQSSGGVCGFCDQIYFTNNDFEVVSTQVHGSGGSDHNAYSAVLRPTHCGDSNPVTPPTDVTPDNDSGDSSSSVKVVEWLGKDGCNLDSPCADAQSDCDGDGDCAGDLICWQRSNGETKAGYDVSIINPDADVCIQPEETPESDPGSDEPTHETPNEDESETKMVTYLGKDSCTSVNPCQDAQSDCDGDGDCAGDLICWQRSNGETKAGYDVSTINVDADVCIQPEETPESDPESDEPTNETPDEDESETKMVTYLGKDACTSVNPCQDAQSDCDQNDDCEGALVCWQRSSGESRAGYDTSDIAEDADVCVQQQESTDQNEPSHDNEPTDSQLTDSMSDEFNGNSVDQTKWTVMRMNAAWKNGEKECYVEQNTAVREGNLVLTAGRRTGMPWENLDCGVQQYFSGSIEAKTYFLHGTVEVRAKLPSGDGLWPAIWFLGHGQTWPACGEIDLMEVANKDPVGSQATLHYGPPRGNSINLGFGRTPDVPLKNSFHTWKITRTSDLIVMYFDGVEFGRKTRQEVLNTNYPNANTMFDAPMRLILNVAVGGGFTGIGNRPPNMATWDKPTMEVDYVRTWADEPDNCLDKVVCGQDTCASCQGRIDWLMTNRGMTEAEAKAQVESEFPNDCVCDRVMAFRSSDAAPFQSSDTGSVESSDKDGEKSIPLLPMIFGIFGGLVILTFFACALHRYRNGKLDLMCESCATPLLDSTEVKDDESKVSSNLELTL